MSTFEGRFVEEELSFIRADNFLRKNHGATVFLLSHLHTDHMAGLGSEEFLDVLTSDVNTFLFCSSLTREMLLRYKWCKIPPEKIVGVSVNQVFSVADTAPPHINAAITPLPAGHCPGSVMFLIETDKCRVLYTGDIRMTENELKQFSALHSENKVKHIDHLYLDMTFCSTSYRRFPPRTEAEAQILGMVTKWLVAAPTNRVALMYNSYFGLESLLIVLARHFGMKIHVVERESLENYRIIAELQDALTADEDAHIHLCPVPKFRKKPSGQADLKSILDPIGTVTDEPEQVSEIILPPCPVCLKIDSKYLKKIKPCAMSFRNTDATHYEVSATVFNVAYSCHCSLTELTRVVYYLNPTMVHPCAFPDNQNAYETLAILYEEVEDHGNVLDFDKNLKKHLAMRAARKIEGPNPSETQEEADSNLFEGQLDEALEEREAIRAANSMEQNNGDGLEQVQRKRTSPSSATAYKKRQKRSKRARMAEKVFSDQETSTESSSSSDEEEEMPLEPIPEEEEEVILVQDEEDEVILVQDEEDEVQEEEEEIILVQDEEDEVQDEEDEVQDEEDEVQDEEDEVQDEEDEVQDEEDEVLDEEDEVLDEEDEVQEEEEDEEKPVPLEPILDIDSPPM